MEQHLSAGTVPGADELSYLTGLAARMTGRTGTPRGRTTAAEPPTDTVAQTRPAGGRRPDGRHGRAARPSRPAAAQSAPLNQRS